MPAKKEAIIQVQGFYKAFGDKVVHDGLDFDLYEGEVVSLIGGSGTGKSVFLRSLIGLEVPDRGKIFYKGRDVTGLSEDEWNVLRKEIAYVFQGGALFDSLTVEDNLIYPLDAHTKLSTKEKLSKVNEILEILGLEGSNKLLPSDLSGGMQKRAGLARAIILEPKIILYDEPTAGLDPYNTKNIQDIILDLKSRGRGGVLVTHDMPSAMATSERIALLQDGKIKVSGRVKELKGKKLIQDFIKGEVLNGKA